MQLTMPKLALHKETLRALNEKDLRSVIGRGGDAFETTYCSCVVSNSTSCQSVGVTCGFTVIGDCCNYTTG